ncbi:hypothetical protein [Bartonella grahamii]|uniref:hypothetical protein n=1 Tax=Bartonella grahamii TaxID=33045 RepID=UPI002E7B1280|nr:hypothetical protein [Bartonella grahamii]
MRNFASGLTYTINDSTPIIYGNACSPNDFMYHIGARGLHGVFDGGVGGAFGGMSGGPAEALSGNLLGAAGGFLSR